MTEKQKLVTIILCIINGFLLPLTAIVNLTNETVSTVGLLVALAFGQSAYLLYNYSDTPKYNGDRDIIKSTHIKHSIAILVTLLLIVGFVWKI